MQEQPRRRRPTTARVERRIEKGSVKKLREGKEGRERKCREEQMLMKKKKKERVPLQQADGCDGPSRDTEDFHKMLRAENQTVSSGFTAMTLWPKPLCCLGCKLHVRAQNRGP